MNTATADDCPRCGATTVSLREALPWCAACEWNLDGYDRARQAPEFGWGWVDRRTHQLAARLFAYPFPSLADVFAVALIVLAVALRPRFGRVDPDLEILSREQAPELHALVEQVATTIGAPLPHVIGVDDSLNAYAMAVGPRRRRVLALGLPLWGTLDGQERVALLGHELGHFVNGDVRRSLVTQPALTMLGNAADLFRPVDQVRGGGIVEMIGDALGRTISWTLSRVLFAGHLLLVVAALRDSQRAEYLADEMAARAAGTPGAARVLDVLLRHESVALVVRQACRRGEGPEGWRADAAGSLAAAADSMPLLRQLSVREQNSLFASHPPQGLRHRMLTARPPHEPRVVLTDERVARIDAELARHYQRVSRQIALAG
ncbi:M48 family metallopeptidase [Micromonospora costi]|uniref:M48 family metallopeptidase n=1 Tax=Micromonospora costi TaxID=1530042 RepID=UPI0033FAB9BC